MKRKTFIAFSSALAATPFISSIKDMLPQERLKNWAGNLEYSTSNVSFPKTVGEIQQLVKKHDKLKVLGTRHCFNRIADSKHNLLSTRELNKVVSLDENARTVTVEAGIKYGELCPWLNEKGFALHNLASLPHISVGGSFTTATHGSGVTNGNLSTAVSAFEFITANGDIVQLSRAKDGEKFLAAVVGLGGLGVITKATLNIQPAFSVRQNVYEHLPLSQLKENFEKIVSAGYSVSLFTDWQSDNINEVWVKARVDNANNTPSSEFFGAKAAAKNMHPIAELSAENCTDQMGVPGPWYDRLPHFKMGFTPSSGKELQAEYFVPMKNAVDAIMAIQQLGKQTGPHLFISEIRTIAADDLWISPCYRQPSVAIHFTWKQEWDAVSKLLPIVEKELSVYNAKPHWGKLFTIAPATLASRYEKMSEFKKMLTSYDPKGKFRNGFLDTNIFGT